MGHVLNRAALRRGFSLIEMMITLAVVAVVIFLGAPSFAAWIQNTQIRSAAESMLTGISLARVEALKRNATVRFQMTTSTDGSCGISATATNWVVSEGNATGRCNAPDLANGFDIVRVKPSGEGTSNVAYSSGPDTFDGSIAFDALGRVTPLPEGIIFIDVTNPIGGDCATSAGPMRCLEIQVTPGGQVRTCDPAVADSSDPRKC
jgi:type IV fimbrial biogenesis protein FimT